MRYLMHCSEQLEKSTFFYSLFQGKPTCMHCTRNSLVINEMLECSSSHSVTVNVSNVKVSSFVVGQNIDSLALCGGKRRLKGWNHMLIFRQNKICLYKIGNEVLFVGTFQNTYRCFQVYIFTSDHFQSSVQAESYGQNLIFFFSSSLNCL